MASPTLCAILARFNFNHNDAVEYCETTAYNYPHLTKEYRAHRDALLMSEEAEAEDKQAELDEENEYYNSLADHEDRMEDVPENIWWNEET